MRLEAIDGVATPREWAQRQRARAETYCHSVIEPVAEYRP
jgi:hypothetical protein